MPDPILDAEGKPVVVAADESKPVVKDEGKPPVDAGTVKDDQLSTSLDVQEVLEEYDLDSPADLKDFVSELNKKAGKIGDRDLETLVENSKILEKYQADWARMEEEKLRESETPEDTITRLEKEKRDMITDTTKKANQEKSQRAAETALGDFGDTVAKVIASAQEVPKEYRDFASQFMGVDNAMNEVDITDKAAVRRVAKANVKLIQKFEQKVIKRYLDGKVAIPKVTSTETVSNAPGGEDAANPKTLKEAKKIMMEGIKGFAR